MWCWSGFGGGDDNIFRGIIRIFPVFYYSNYINFLKVIIVNLVVKIER